MSTVIGSMGDAADCDVLVVGAGFGGVYAIYKFRQLGLNVKCFEAGGDLGGVWYWNRYPGARVDSEFPFYCLSIPEVYTTWKWSKRFPDHKELRQHFDHMDKVLGLRKDIQFNARVNSCQWDEESNKWTVKTEAGHMAKCKYLFLATGLLHRRHYPDFAGFNEYQGVVHHSGFWPDDLSVKGKKVAIIGAGATAVQITQDLAKEADSLTVLMRRPSYCQPMRQRPITEDEQRHLKAYYRPMLEASRKSTTGFPLTTPKKSFWEASEEERLQHWEESWARGAFNFNLTNYRDLAVDPKANKIAYDFWRGKIHERMKNKEKAELMAPAEMPYYLNTKRSPLEGDYYEMLDQEHVSIVQLTQNPLKSFTRSGMLFEDGTEKDFDVVVLATGFDSFSGSVSKMGLISKDGNDIKDIWGKEIATYLGIAISGFPNCFMIYSPQAPTAFSNGPTILECQTDFIVDVIARAQAEKIRTVEATKEAQEEWRIMIEKMCENTLLPLTNSWWNAGNIPGKKTQMLTFPAGIDVYEMMCRKKFENWEGFEVVKEAV